MPTQKPSEPIKAAQAPRQICRYSGCRQPALEGEHWCATHTDPKYHQRRPSRYPKRFCAHPGCHNYARHDMDYCSSHDTPAKREGGLRRAPCPRCAHPGCRKYALRGGQYCMHHHPDRPRPPRAAKKSSAPKIPCAQPGCKSWAMHGQKYCYVHRTPQGRAYASRPHPARCAFPDCKSWAIQGQKYCYAHRTEERRQNALRRRQGHRSPPCSHPDCRKRAMIGQHWCRQHHPMGNADAAALIRQHGLYSKYYSHEEFRLALEAAGIEGIKQELALARLTLWRAIEKYEQSPQELKDTVDLLDIVTRSVGHITRLVKLDHQLDPTPYQEQAGQRRALKMLGMDSMEELEAFLEETEKKQKKPGF